MTPLVFSLLHISDQLPGLEPNTIFFLELKRRHMDELGPHTERNIQKRQSVITVTPVFK